MGAWTSRFWHGNCTPCPVSETIPIIPVDANDAPQRVVKVRRDYNSWVASETMEDYALRYTPQRSRIGSEWRVANTAFSVASGTVLTMAGALVGTVGTGAVLVAGAVGLVVVAWAFNHQRARRR